MSDGLPSAESIDPAPLKVIPRIPDARTAFIKDTFSNLTILLTVAGIIYIAFYAMSAGWHDGMRYA